MSNEALEPEIIYSKVVGVSFEGRQQVLQALERIEQTDKTAVKLFLQRDIENPVDPFAMAVYATYFDSTFISEVTRQLGYIRKEMAAEFVGDMTKGYDFEIIDFESTGGYKKSRGVNITILRKEANMPKITAMDLLKNKKTKRGNLPDYIRLSKDNSAFTVRFLKSLSDAFIEVTHSIEVAPKKYERFTSPQYVNGYGDDSVVDPAMDAGFKPWYKLVIPCIDRADGKVKLFAETMAFWRNFSIFEEEPTTEGEKAVKFGTLTAADFQIIQQGEGRDRKIMALPVPGTIRALSAEEKKLDMPDPKAGLRVLTKEEIERIVQLGLRKQAGQTMNVSSTPFEE